MSLFRLGTDWAGNAAEKVMKIHIQDPDGGPDITSWMDWALWQFEQTYLDMMENFFWYSKFNRRANGTIGLKDQLTGKVIPRGSGILEQITNQTSIAKVNWDFLQTILGDAFYQQPDKAGKTITLMGGKGAKRDFHNAAMAAQAQILGANGLGDVASKFVTGSGYNLALGGYFDTFYHIDGCIVKFKEAEIFNSGKMAAVAPRHPETGFSLESHRMVFIDDNEYDGMMNIQHVTQKGRAFKDGIIQGLTDTPRSIQALVGSTGGSLSKYLTTDMDQSSYTRLATGGIQLMRGNGCFDIQCTAGL